MSLSIDKDLGEQGENARAVLASWLDDYISGRCDRADMQAQFLSVCRSNPDAPWDALALLDQYQRRGRIDVALARSLKTDIAQLVFGVANQTETKADGAHENQDTTDVTIDTTGSRWRKLMADRDPASINSEPAFVDPSLLRRDDEATAFRRELEEPPTRPPPPLKHSDDDTVLARPRKEEPTLGVHAHGPAVERERERERPVRSSSVPPPGLTSDVLRDRYELTSILGRGSAGTVYKAVDRHRAHLDPTSRCVAVKVLKLNYQDRPDELAQLEREFHEAQSLSHPNVVSVFDLDRDGNVYFIVMELLEGELLADILKRLDGQPMARHYALGIISSVGAALAHAHRRGVVHADLKPRNVMITTTGEVRVLDFGFARDRPLELHMASGLNDGPAAAAPAYASVERVNGSDPHPSDDVYSLACIAYELLSGRHPFGGRSAPLARAHGRAPQRIPGLAGKQQQALQRALLWTRGERRIDVVELLAALGCGEAPSRLGSPSELAVPESSLSRWRRAAVAVTLALIFAGGAYAVWQYGLLPRNLAHVLPVTPPIADRELQSEASGNPADNARSSDTVGSQPIAPVTPPTVQPLPSVQRQTSPSVPAPTQNGSSPTPVRPRGEAQVSVPLPETPRPSASANDSIEKEDQPRQQTPRAQSEQASPSAAGSSAPVAGSASAGATRPVIIEFEKDSYVTSEGDGSVRLVIRRTGSTRRAVNVSWQLRSNSAEMGADFAGIGPGVERIPAGVREASITIPLVQDSIKETTELFLVELQVDEEGVSLGERSSAAVIIVDDD